VLKITFSTFCLVLPVFIPFDCLYRERKFLERGSASKLPAQGATALYSPEMCQRQSEIVRLRHRRYGVQPSTDKAGVRQTVLTQNAERMMSIPWAMQMKAISIEEPGRLVQTLTGAILGCGGWVLSRGANDTGVVNMLFEFERQSCVDIYTMLVAVGLELSQSGHIRFTELCQCTCHQQRECGTEIASIDLEIQTFPIEMVYGARPAEIA
jgi:hypothetical protein